MKKLLVVLSVLAFLSMALVASAEEPASAEKVDVASVAEETEIVDEEILELLDPSQGLQHSVGHYPTCAEVPLFSPCDENCPEACTMNGQAHPCGCEDLGGFFGVKCVCPL